MNKSIFLSFFTVFLCNNLMAQQRLFNQLISTNQLGENMKLTNDYASTFTDVVYYQQNSFNINQDLIFNLPGGQLVNAQFDKSFTYKNGSFSASYKILNEPYSELVFSNFNDAITGMYIGQNQEKLIFHQNHQNIMAIGIVNELKLIEEELSSPCVSVDDFQTRAINHANICLESSTCSGASVIDLMFVYTPAAKTAWGGASPTLSNIATIVTNLNTSMSLSGIANVSYNIVHTYEASYTESTSMQTDLDRLRMTNDGFMDEIHALRDTYGADLVPLINGITSGGCGIGNLNTSTTNFSNNQAFNVTRFGCAVGNLTVAHELGHNMGLRHDWYVDTSSTPCSHHHGYINQTAINNGSSSTTNQRWRTIMSYNDNCADTGFTCTRINRWSNPELVYNGDVMGVDLGDSNPSHEAFAFRRMACVVASFKSPLNTSVFNESETRIYPNPAQDNLFIETLIEDAVIEIFNTMGQKLFQTTDKIINVENLASGVYYLNIISETQKDIKFHKFIKN